MMCMSKGAFFILAAALVFGLTACQGAPQAAKPYAIPQNAPRPDQVKWTYLPGGLILNVKADNELNPFEGFSHNLMLCVYQLSGPDLFQELAAGIGGIRKMLECAPFDPTVVHVARHFIFPGEEAALVMDRAEGARYVGLVAGYNDIQPGMVTTLYAFPVSENSKGWSPWSKVYNPGILTVDILLDTHSIQRIGVD
jgi:type VI secretion system VasD/TssJ family lipoprotein